MKSLIIRELGTADPEKITPLRTNKKNSNKYVYHFGGGKADRRHRQNVRHRSV